MSFIRTSSISIGLAVCIVGDIFACSLLKSGSRDVAALETIRGVPYPYDQNHQSFVVSESLAHADILLREPVAAKELTLIITFIPHQTKTLAVGIRQDPFWLSYQPITIFDKDINKGDPSQPITKAITIPLTDKIQAADRSIDMMFFADTNPEEIIVSENPIIARPLEDVAKWELVSVSASVRPHLPSKAAIKAYIKSIIKQERPL